MNSLPLFFLAFYLIFLAFVLAAGIVNTIARWKIFRKCGVPGWFVFIPFLNDWKFFEIATDHGALMFVPLVTSFISSLILSGIGRSAGNGAVSADTSVWKLLLLSILVLVLTAVGIIVNCVALFNLANRFGKSVGFCIGTMLLSFVFLPILAFGHAEYDGGSQYNKQEPPEENF